MKWLFNEEKSHLPVPEGPFTPACCDVMIGFGESSLFTRFYYPAEDTVNLKENKSQWITWIPDPIYLDGYAKVISLFNGYPKIQYLFKLILWIVIWIVSGNLLVPILYGRKIRSKEPLKCIINSHGLGGNRFQATATCMELASRGFLVISLEHRDRSSCVTYHYQGEQDAKHDKKTFITFKSIHLGKSHYLERNAQLRKRVQECERVVELLRDLSKGNAPSNVMDLVPTKHPKEFSLKDLNRRIDMDGIVIMGHSFGAATALATLSLRSEIKVGVLLDAWMFPLKEMNEIEKRAKQPLLIINSQTFQIRSNMKLLEKFHSENDSTYRPMYTIRHTTHEYQTDTVFAFGSWLNWFMKKLDPQTAASINNFLILSFLQKRLNYPEQVDDCLEFLLDQSENVSLGATAVWA